MSSLKFHYSYAVLTTQVRLTCLFQPTGEMLLVPLSEFLMRILRDEFGQNLEKCFPALLKRSRLLSDLELTHEDTRMKTAMRSISICFPFSFRWEHFAMWKSLDLPFPSPGKWREIDSTGAKETYSLDAQVSCKWKQFLVKWAAYFEYLPHYDIMHWQKRMSRYYIYV